MASTKNPIDAFDYARIMIKNMPLEDIQVKLVNKVAFYMWMYAPWRWTLGSVPTVTPLVNGTQDYTINYPADFMYTYRATLLVAPTPPHRNLEVVPSLETNVGFVGQPSQVSYPAAAGAVAGLVRITPKPVVPTGVVQAIIGLYKKSMTVFTSASIYTAFMPFDDEWFNVFEEGVLWVAYQYADDKRAGEASVDVSSGKTQYSGQRGTFEAALAAMADREKLPSINPFDQSPAKEKTK